MRPQLQQPITWERLFDEVESVLVKGGVQDQVQIEHYQPLDTIHAINPRRYAQVDPNVPMTMQFADATRSLPPAHRLGLCAHEVGHILRPGSEVNADRAAYEKLGVVIGYDDRWPGKGLQVAIDAPQELLQIFR